MIKSAQKEGHTKGMEEGIKSGIEQGIEQNQRQVIINMLKENIDISIISKVTGLSEHDIIDIKNNV